jgi:hypothetical protein
MRTWILDFQGDIVDRGMAHDAMPSRCRTTIDPSSSRFASWVEIDARSRPTVRIASRLSGELK